MDETRRGRGREEKERRREVLQLSWEGLVVIIHGHTTRARWTGGERARRSWEQTRTL